MVTGSAAEATDSPEERPVINKPRATAVAAAEGHLVEIFNAFLQSFLGQPGELYIERCCLAELIL